MAIEMLLKAGIENFQLSIGQVEYFKALIDEAKMDAETVEELRNLISNKNIFGVEDLLNGLDISDDLKGAFLQLSQLFGGVEVLDRASQATANLRAKASILRLQNIYNLLKDKEYDKYISFDFGMLRRYEYYTGIIFQAYTYGTGEPVAKGGRYDNLMAHFGRPQPAIGFGITIDQLMIALSRQNIKINPKEGK
jgi:ATP phosphoribosyltransferase regulatory subunit